MSHLNPSAQWMHGGVAGGACRPLIHRHGAEAARGAHNSEVTGSKPVAGIFFIYDGGGAGACRSGHSPVSHSFPVIAAPLLAHFLFIAYLFPFNACLANADWMTLFALSPLPLYMRKTLSTSARCAEIDAVV